ncbi:integrase, catalytic region, zinc finger, CCHC-type containing protein, partial [Tanacetum coccineum]
LVEIILFIVDSGCSRHMMRNLKLLSNFVEKLLGMVKFGKDQIALILGYGDLVQGNIIIKRVYYVEELNHNLFFIGQFCSRGTDLYSITLQDTSTPNLICLMAKASSLQAWLWHRGRLSHLNFDIINLLSKYDIVTGLLKLKFVKDHPCSSSELGKEKTIATKCFTQNCSLVIPRHEKTPYHIINGPKPSVNSVSFLARYVTFLSPGIQSQENVPQAAETVTTSNELDLLFSLMFDELLNETTPVVSNSSIVTVVDTPNQRRQQNTATSTSTTIAADTPPLNIQTTPESTSQAPTITTIENINQA